METKIMKEGDKAIVSVGGRIDTLTAPELQKTLEQYVVDCKDIILDCRNLTYISSAGLRVLLIAYKTLKQKGGSIQLKNVGDSIMQVLKMTQFDSFLQIV